MEVQHDEARKTNRTSNRPKVQEDLNLMKAAVCALTCEDLRIAVLQFGKFLEDKIDWHRTRGGRFHNERAAAYDVALQELKVFLNYDD